MHHHVSSTVLLLEEHSSKSSRLVVGVIRQRDASTAAGPEEMWMVAVKCPATCTRWQRLLYQAFLCSVTIDCIQVSNVFIKHATKHLSEVEASMITAVLNQAAAKSGKQLPGNRPNTGFIELGLSSNQLMTARRVLSHQLGRPVSPAVLLSYPTLDSPVSYISKPLSAISDPTLLSRVEIPPVTDIRASVAGAEFLSPGHEINLGSLWQSMSSANNSLQRIPVQRFDIDTACAANEMLYVLHGHFVTGAELFEAPLIQMGPAEVHCIDPSHRVLLEMVYGACVQAGENRQSLVRTETGIFLGLCNVFDWQVGARTLLMIPGHSQCNEAMQQGSGTWCVWRCMAQAQRWAI